MIARSIALGIVAAALSLVPATAADPLVNPDVGVPVFPYDLSDRPYRVLAEVSVGVGNATIFSKEVSQTELYRALWKKAAALGADAVVNVRYGDSHVAAFSWGKTRATGTAIRFVDPPAPR